MAAPGTVAETLTVTADYGPVVHVSAGPAYGRHEGHGQVGAGGTLQLNPAPDLHLTPRWHLTPFLSGEFAWLNSSYSARYPNDVTSLIGAGVGLQVGFGALRPPNADRLPVAYPWLVQPFTLGAAYVRWWGQVGSADLGGGGRNGVLVGVTVRFGP